MWDLATLPRRTVLLLTQQSGTNGLPILLRIYVRVPLSDLYRSETIERGHGQTDQNRRERYETRCESETQAHLIALVVPTSWRNNTSRTFSMALTFSGPPLDSHTHPPATAQGQITCKVHASLLTRCLLDTSVAILTLPATCQSRLMMRAVNEPVREMVCPRRLETQTQPLDHHSNPAIRTSTDRRHQRWPPSTPHAPRKRTG